MGFDVCDNSFNHCYHIEYNDLINPLQSFSSFQEQPRVAVLDGC